MYQYIITETASRVKRPEGREVVMNFYLAEQIAKDRVDEARAMAAQARLMGSTPPAPAPLRVALGLALIRVGRSLAGQAARRAAGPRRVAA
jgi:hypothetical protein